MAKDNEDVSKETVRQALAIQTKAMLGFTEALQLLTESMVELRKAIEAMAEIMEEEDG